MGRFRFRGLFLAVTILSFMSIAGCGGSKKAGTPLFAGHITLTPTTNTSLVTGGTLVFAGSAQSASGTNLSTTITYTSSDTSILNLAPNGIACAGHWDLAFTTCTPGATGPVTVTASALGATSVPTWVFVHPAIDNVTVTGILLNGLPVQEPCLSGTQSMTLEAHAFSQGTDVTSAVGPFTWSANNPSVVNLIPLVNSAYNFPTNQATAVANIPGITQIYATASGVTSTSFQQPQYANSQGTNSPILDFFSTCPIQNISLEIGTAGSGQTSFVTAKGDSEAVVATLTDVVGNSSLPNTNGGVILSKVPLTWTSSQPGVMTVGSSCLETCTITTGSPGAGTITASCSPPTCNAGFPFVPATLSTTAQVNACTQFFLPNLPNQSFTCQELIPVPVYATPLFIAPSGNTTLTPPTGSIAGVVTGTPGSASVLATTTNCASVIPTTCSTSTYYVSTAKAAPGAETPIPVSPNSFLFDLAGDKIFMGSEFGAEIINPSQFGTANNPFSSIGTVTGNVLAASTNGFVAAFSDTVHTPNQVYIVNTLNSTTPAIVPLNISAATASAFSPDGLKTFVLGAGGTSLYVYSTVQALQGPIALSGASNSIAFSPNGAFAYVAEAANGAVSANVTAFANCNNQVAATVPLPASPLLMKVLPNVHLDGKDSYGNPIPDGVHVLVLDATGFDILTSTVSPPATGTLCPQGLTFISGDPLRLAQRVELGQGTLQPVNFFSSADGSQLYVANATSSTIFVYNFLVGSVIGGIPLLNNATPLSASMSVDAGTILIAGSDGMLHEVTTSSGGSDLVQLAFPNIPNYLNAFCNFTPASGPCALNVSLAKP
ncbi:MAG: hypothetical protein WCB05_17400 [Candidatus Sulfotelmatobacter sp.]